MNKQIDLAFNTLPKPSRKNFEEVFDNYSTKFENQTDLIRNEISLCITHNLYQAAIMLTNHLLEKFLRDVIVIKESGIEKMIPENQKKLKSAYKQRASASLDNLTDEALKIGVLDSIQHQKVKEYIKTIRNPYSHGSSFQAIKDFGPIKTITASFSGEGGFKVTDTDVKSYLPLQALFQGAQAEKDALIYFKFVDSLLLTFYSKENGGIYKRQY